MLRIGNQMMRAHSEGADLGTAGDYLQFGLMPLPDQLALWTSALVQIELAMGLPRSDRLVALCCVFV